MIIPVRCITCGRPISGKWDLYNESVSQGKDPKKVLDELGVKSYCCRNMFITHKELILDISEFKKKFAPKEEEVVEAEVKIVPVVSEPGLAAEEVVPDAAEETTPVVVEKEEQEP